LKCVVQVKAEGGSLDTVDEALQVCLF